MIHNCKKVDTAFAKRPRLETPDTSIQLQYSAKIMFIANHVYAFLHVLALYHSMPCLFLCILLFQQVIQCKHYNPAVFFFKEILWLVQLWLWKQCECL